MNLLTGFIKTITFFPYLVTTLLYNLFVFLYNFLDKLYNWEPEEKLPEPEPEPIQYKAEETVVEVKPKKTRKPRIKVVAEPTESKE